MQIKFGDLFGCGADFIGITTNGSVKSNGRAVMGKGVALEAKKLFPGVEVELGQKIQAGGNVLHLLAPNLFSLPVKFEWHERAQIPLIEQSLQELSRLSRRLSAKSFAIPLPGAGSGGLPANLAFYLVLQAQLPDNVLLMLLPSEGVDLGWGLIELFGGHYFLVVEKSVLPSSSEVDETLDSLRALSPGIYGLYLALGSPRQVSAVYQFVKDIRRDIQEERN